MYQLGTQFIIRAQCKHSIFLFNEFQFYRLTKDWPRFKEELDMLKFLCTDFWSSIYKRQVDNLRTNHQGVYVLLDNEFRFFSRISAGNQYLEYAPLVSKYYIESLKFSILISDAYELQCILLQYVTFTCGLIRGALANLGINCVVSAEIHSLPACKFNIRVQKS